MHCGTDQSWTDWCLSSQAAHFGVQSALFNPLHPWLFPELLELHSEDEDTWQAAMQRVAGTKHPQGLPALIGVPQKHRAWVMKHESWVKVVDWVKQVSELTFLTRFQLLTCLTFGCRMYLVIFLQSYLLRMCLMNVLLWWQLASLHVPLEMLLALKNAVTCLQTISPAGVPLGADDLVPILVCAAVDAGHLPGLPAALQYIDETLPRAMESGEMGYYLALALTIPSVIVQESDFITRNAERVRKLQLMQRMSRMIC